MKTSLGFISLPRRFSPAFGCLLFWFLSVSLSPAQSGFQATPLNEYQPGQLYLGVYPGLLYDNSNRAPSDHDADLIDSVGDEFAHHHQDEDKEQGMTEEQIKTELPHVLGKSIMQALEHETEPPRVRTVKIGEVEIDTGRMAIADLCRLGELEDRGAPLPDGQINGEPYPDGTPCKIGIVSPAGLGDGRYPVFVTLVNLPDCGERVAEIIIRCSPYYYLADDPETAKIIVQNEKRFLEMMNATCHDAIVQRVTH